MKKYYLIYLSIIVLTATVTAQNDYSVKWMNYSKGPHSDFIRAIETDDDGNIYSIEINSDSINKISDNKEVTISDYYSLSKYSEEGTLIWKVPIHGSGDIDVIELEYTSNDKIIIAGHFTDIITINDFSQKTKFVQEGLKSNSGNKPLIMIIT